MSDSTPTHPKGMLTSGAAAATCEPVPDPTPLPDPGLAPEPPPVSRRSGLWPQLVSLARYLSQSEVHTYAFSVAANAILSLFPFIVMTWTIERAVFHSPAMEGVLGDMLRYFLPAH